MNTTENTAKLDPMCGKELKERDPRYATEIEGQIHFFCSFDCKKMFDRGMDVIAARMAHAGEKPH